MEELLNIHESIQKGCLKEALLKRSLNFAMHRSLSLLHSLRWRFFLGLISLNIDSNNYIQEWIQNTQKNVREWNEIKHNLSQRLQTSISSLKSGKNKGRFGESSSSSSDDDDDNIENKNVENPLIPKAESSYALRYHVENIRTIAKKDIDRLHWEILLFDDSNINEALLDIIINYCLRYNCEYKQGMHEIVAFILYLTHNDASLINEEILTNEESHKLLINNFKKICPLDGVTALSFFIFESIMNNSGIQLSHWYYVNTEYLNDDIVSAAHKVQGEFLTQLDSTLSNQMNVVYEIESTTYLIRWLRLLFLREFSLHQCADLWDVFLSEKFLLKKFNYKITNSIVTMFAVCMLIFVKNELMNGYIEAFKRVMNYPPVENIGVLVEMAILKIDPQKINLGRYFTPSYHRESEILELPQKEEKPLEKITENLNSISTLSSKELMIQQGNILTSIIEKLEIQWFPPPNISNEEKDVITENYIHSIAELKRVRDVLLRHVENNLEN